MTKQQRKEIYWAAMFEIEAFGLQGEGLCSAINNATPGMPYLFITNMKELFSQIPVHSGDYWFPRGRCRTERLECLSKAISLCESKTK